MIPFDHETFDPYKPGLRDYRPSSTPPTSKGLRAVLWLLLFALIFMLGFASGTAYGADHCIRSFEIRPTVMHRLGSYDIEARIRIEPHAHHRAFQLSFTSDAGPAGSSLRELNNVTGELSPITQDPIRWRDKPGGHYVFTLSVLNGDGKVLEQQAVETKVVGDDGDAR
jgi:hypothetical protein